MLGSGTSTDPYQIATETDLRAITVVAAGTYYKLMNNITMSSTAFRPIGKIPSGLDFCGDFNGNGKKIINLVVNETTQFGGLFQSLYTGAHIYDLGLENVSITCSSNYVGALSGYFGSGANTSATVERCYATGTVTQTGASSLICGGLLGAGGPGTVHNCWSSVNVSGGDRVGGLIGNTNGDIRYCYSTGTVTGTGANVGGFVGLRATNGVYEIITDCYWDINTSGKSASNGSGITGLTTAEMKNTVNFGTGWDSTIWDKVNGSYMQLKAFMAVVNKVTKTLTGFVGHMQSLTAKIGKALRTKTSTTGHINASISKSVKKYSVSTAYMRPVNANVIKSSRTVNAVTSTVSSHMQKIGANVSKAGRVTRHSTAWINTVNGAIITHEFHVQIGSRQATSYVRSISGNVFTYIYQLPLRVTAYTSHVENQTELDVATNKIQLDAKSNSVDVEALTNKVQIDKKINKLSVEVFT